MKDIKRQCLEQMKERGMTYEELGTLLGITRSSAHVLLHSKHYVSAKNFLKLSKIFDIKINTK